MAIKTYINGSENGTITFKGDTEPCAVYVNGERQDNISYIPQEVKGEKSVMYKSEYKKNIRSLSIEGNTYQETEEASPIIEQAIASDGFTSTGSNFIAYYITTEQFTALQEWATDKGYTGNFNLFVSVKNTGEIPTGFAVVAGNSLDDVLAGSNTTTIYYKSSYGGETNNTVTVNLSNTVYIGIGNTDDGVGDNASEYLNLFLSNFTLCLQPTEYKGIPSPENPSAVSNSNDNGTVVTLHGKNLFDWSAVKNPQIVIEENGRKIIMPIRTESNSNGNTSTWSRFRQLFPRLKAGDTATLSFNSNAEIKKIYISIVNVMWASGQTMTVTEDMLDGEVAFYGNYYAHGQTEQVIISDFQMELGTTATAYEPYFNKTVQIPSSVTLPDGVSLEMRLAKVGDKADRLSVKGSRVIYSQNTERITLTGEESGWSETEGVYKYSLGKALIENSGYCTHFKLSGTGENNTFGVESDGITFKTDVATGLENFKVWLKAKSDAGNAVQVTVALANPVEYDITDTEAGQNILALSAYTKNLTNIIEATPNDTANPDVSSISISYAKWGANLNN